MTKEDFLLSVTEFIPVEYHPFNETYRLWKAWNRYQQNEPEFDSLNNILNKICPNITVMQYKQLLQLVQAEYRVPNCADTSRKSIYLSAVYRFLCDSHLI